ncbi:MAG: extracellular solute-binding protein [Limnochordaceae bacterium]|nr:extracellular solute-binding protein [Limnochordaceae bacterium]
MKIGTAISILVLAATAWWGTAWAAPATAATSAPKTGSRTVITIATYGDITVAKDAWDDIKATFEAQHPEYELRYTIIPYSDYITKLTTLLATDQAPDVFQTWAQYKPRWVSDGILLDVTDFVAKSKVLRPTEFFPVALECAKFNGRFYGTPHDFNSEVYYFNVDLADEAGVPVPDNDWTIRDLETVATKISRPDKGVFGTSNPIYWGGGLQWVYNFSGHYWLTDNNQRATVADPKVIDMVKYWERLTYDLRVTPSSLLPMQPGKDEFAGYVGAWLGWVAYMDQLSQFEQKAQAAGHKFWNWTMLPYPAGPAAQRNFAQGHMWSISARNPHPERAFVLAEWLSGYEGQKVWAKHHAFQPLGPNQELWSIYLGFLPQSKRQQVAAFLLGSLYAKYALNFTYWPTYPEMQDIWTRAMSDVFASRKSPDTVLANANRLMDAVLARQQQQKASPEKNG